MPEQETDTTTAQVGTDQDEAARAAAAAATAADSAGNELTDEQKEAKAAETEAARKAEEVRRSKEGTDPVIQKRIDRESRRRKEAEEKASTEREARHKAELETAELRGRLTAMQEKAGPQSDPNAPPARPKPEDFETIYDFNTALLDYTDKVTDYRAKQIQAESDKKIEEIRKTAQSPTETPQQRATREFREKVDGTLGKVAEEFGDDVVETLRDDNFPMAVGMRDAIFEKDSAPKILAFLADNPKVAAKIAAMSVPQQIREIDKLERSITTKKETNAMPPLTPVNGKGVSAPKSIKDAKTSEERYAIWRDEESERARKE